MQFKKNDETNKIEPNFLGHNELSSLDKAAELRSQSKFYIIIAFILALIIHAITALITLFMKNPEANKIITKSEIVFKKKVKPTKPKNEPSKEKTLATIAPPVKEERPSEAKHLAEFNTRTDVEEKAKVSSAQAPSLSNRVEIPHSKANVQAQKKPKKVLKKEQGQEKAEDRDTPSVDDYLAEKPELNEHDPLGLQKNIQGNSERFAMPFPDHLPGVKEGDETKLNAWQWRHAPFFNRIKAKIAQIWAPNVQIARFDPQGALLGQQDRITVMSVTIDKSGLIKSLSVALGSGVAYLDEEAERSFKTAQSFPFPPKELFVEKDEFTFKFAFFLSVSRGFSFDFDWEGS